MQKKKERKKVGGAFDKHNVFAIKAFSVHSPKEGEGGEGKEGEEEEGRK